VRRVMSRTQRVCVCVCERERERERGVISHVSHKKRRVMSHVYCMKDVFMSLTHTCSCLSPNVLSYPFCGVCVCGRVASHGCVWGWRAMSHVSHKKWQLMSHIYHRVATISRLLTIIRLFCRILSLL